MKIHWHIYGRLIKGMMFLGMLLLSQLAQAVVDVNKSIGPINILTNQNGNQASAYRSFTQNPNGLTRKVLQFPLTTDYNSIKIVPRPYAEKTDIQWQCQSTVSSEIGGQIEGYLIANVLS